ncbi:hypothetical protein [Leptospira koniambonensis]|uniref:hypothetical protein n=1 Tax=Leptospira koniambonensis TaxID=2484950 RepID=UPI003EC06535
MQNKIFPQHIMTKKQRYIEIYDDFINLCKQHFDFLISKYKYKFSSKNPNASSSAVCVVTFSKGKNNFEFYYLNAQECELGAYLNIENLSFQLWEIAKIKNLDYIQAAGAISIFNKESLERELNRIAIYLQNNIDTFIEPPKHIIEEVMKERENLNKEFLKRTFTENYEKAVRKSQEAFRLREFRLVIEALEPYKELLTKSDKKRIEISNRFLM